MKDVEGTITKNREIAPGHYLLTAALAQPMEAAAPGQFAMVKVPDREIFLRRPFSIYDSTKKTVSFMYKVVGRGTASLSKAEKGETISVLCPLGKGFSIMPREAYAVVAGGIGLAGVHALIKKLGRKATVFFGCTSESELPLLGTAAHFQPHISTLDGSFGFRGNVVELFGRHLPVFETKDFEVFACGPENMLRSLKKVLEKTSIPCQVSLEERMACGLGLCFGCVKKTVDEEEPYKRVCKEGPVFDLWRVCL